MKDLLASINLWRTLTFSLLICGLLASMLDMGDQRSIWTLVIWFSWMLSANIQTWYEKPVLERRILARRAMVLLGFQVGSILMAILLGLWKVTVAPEGGVSQSQFWVVLYSSVGLVTVVCYLGLTKWRGLNE